MSLEKTIQLAQSTQKPKPLQEKNNSTQQEKNSPRQQEQNNSPLRCRQPPALPLQQNRLFLSTDILQPHGLPLMQRLPGAIFQQDNAWPHTARVSQDCLFTVTTIPSPARSSGMSPIEYIWDHLWDGKLGIRRV
ncbi:transposable element Tcb2 transposase [Trichonephila clavipes]|uniref:Transposable element Tcb2 transposase n=1 Tax=Trichonephila clavipes TaxID=2585209 RepID=A0A8X6RF45_TRICX|nr:transposable element Tcb2 transposase [Trichonephila clavipes]